MRNPLGLIGLLLSVAILSACGGGIPLALQNAPSASAGNAAVTAAGYKLLYSFKGTPDGASPFGGLIAVNGTLYGTTLRGSKNYCSGSCANYCYLGCGTIFSVDKSGGENVVYNFEGNFNDAHDGSWPFDALTAMSGGLYGTTSSGGANGKGTVFTFSASGGERPIYSFAGGNDGYAPEAALTPLQNTLYGTTVAGGGDGCGGYGCGTVFSVITGGTEHVLYSFMGGSDGYRVYAGVTPLGGELYGATLQGGGTGCGGNGCGTIYEVSLQGKESVLYRFMGTSDGAFPNGLIAVGGVLYGTTEGDGAKNSGTFFSVTTSGKLTTLYSFKDIPDGNGPGANLIYVKGHLYGTTVGGGTAGDGTVFKITTSGAESVLYSFKGGSDGMDPQAPVYAHGGDLYGTTASGGGTGCGGDGCGTVFKVRR